MAQSKARANSPVEIDVLRNGAEKAVAEILKNMDATLRGSPGLFASGIELIKVSLKAGSNIEFTVLVAGKDAPKVDASALT